MGSSRWGETDPPRIRTAAGGAPCGGTSTGMCGCDTVCPGARPILAPPGASSVAAAARSSATSSTVGVVVAAAGAGAGAGAGLGAGAGARAGLFAGSI